MTKIDVMGRLRAPILDGTHGRVRARMTARIRQTIRRLAGAAALAVLVLVAGGCSGSDPPPTVTVMTRNLYLGADLSPLFAATADELAVAAAETWAAVEASSFEDRMAAVAQEIREAEPDVIALQEATVWSVQGEGSTEANVRYDLLQLLLDELGALGLSYQVAATADGFNGGLPVEDVGLVDLRDRDVILVRERPGLAVSDSTASAFTAELVLEVVGVELPVTRAWAAVDLEVEGRPVTVVATHLEAFDAEVRDQQLQELLAVVENPATTIVLGDMNLAPTGGDRPAYDVLVSGQLLDVWVAAGDQPGPTCCHDADLRGGSLTRRIDYVLAGSGFETSSAQRVGLGDARTAGGLMPSDHAGVVATLELVASP